MGCFQIIQMETGGYDELKLIIARDRPQTMLWCAAEIEMQTQAYTINRKRFGAQNAQNYNKVSQKTYGEDFVALAR